MNYKYATVKFNGGRGALLCSKCSVIMAEGFDHEDKQHLCRDCIPRSVFINTVDLNRRPELLKHFRENNSELLPELAASPSTGMAAAISSICTDARPQDGEGTQ